MAVLVITIPSQTATPTLAPTPGSYSSAQTVTISDATPSSSIYYTTDGSTPTYPITGTTQQYTSPVLSNPSGTTVFKAIAVATGFIQSAIGTASYTVTALQAVTPTFSPSAGTYSSAQTVAVSSPTPSATIYVTFDGSTPTTSSASYPSGQAFLISSNETIKAIATAPGYSQSSVGSATYTITIAPIAATPTFSPISGNYPSAQTVTVTSQAGATIYYTTDGTTPIT
jgi:hypothetical protein